MDAEEKSFLQQLWENKFVKITLPYIIGAWGFLQVAAFFESRYSWAQNWPDFILVLALVMLPSVLIFSYYQGDSSSISLTKFERFFIPINLVIAIVLASFGVGKSDLNNSASKVMVVNEEGESIERVVPNTSVIKRIVLLPWDFNSTDPEKKWLTFALPQILSSDLEQDNRLIAINPKALAGDYKEYKVQLSRNLPFSIQRKIASDKYCDYFLTGTLEKNGENYLVTTTLFNTKDGKEFYQKKYENPDPIHIVDLISEDFRKELYIENELDENFIDLPVSNLYTNSLAALKFYTESIKQAYFNNNYKAAIENAEKAVTEDPNFALAYAGLSDYNMYLNNISLSKEAVSKAMQLKDALSERMQFAIKYGYMNLESPVKALNLLEMWSQLYPKDYKPYNLLIDLYQARSETEKAKNTALRALDNGHTGQLLLILANLENAQGNMESAQKYYEQFEKDFPHKVKEIFGKGNIYMSQGEFDKAEDHFEKLHLLNPDKSNIIKKLADIQGKKGNFEMQLTKLDQAIALENQFEDSIALMRSKEMVYLNLGQIDKYFEEQEKRWQLSTRIAPYHQLQAELMYPHNIQAFLDKGKKEGLLDKLLDISGKMDKTLFDVDCVVEVNYYIFTEDAKNLKVAMKKCSAPLEKLQTEVQSNVVKAFVEKVNGNYTKAIEHLETVQTASGLDDSHLSFFGEIYYLNKEYDKAAHQFESSLKIEPYDAKLLYQLALTYYAQDKKEAAKTHLQKALEVWKNADANYIPAKKAKAKMTEWFEAI